MKHLLGSEWSGDSPWTCGGFSGLRRAGKGNGMKTCIRCGKDRFSEQRHRKKRNLLEAVHHELEELYIMWSRWVPWWLKRTILIPDMSVRAMLRSTWYGTSRTDIGHCWQLKHVANLFLSSNQSRVSSKGNVPLFRRASIRRWPNFGWSMEPSRTGNCTALHGAKPISVICVGNKVQKYTVYTNVKDGKTCRAGRWGHDVRKNCGNQRELNITLGNSLVCLPMTYQRRKEKRTDAQILNTSRIEERIDVQGKMNIVLPGMGDSKEWWESVCCVYLDSGELDSDGENWS